jgi:hypothetical protein
VSEKKNRVLISERQQAHLLRLAHSADCPTELARRARIILLAYEKVPVAMIAERVGWERAKVRAWRNHWRKEFPHLAQVECLESDDAFRTALVNVLSDFPEAQAEIGEYLSDFLSAGVPVFASERLSGIS